MKFSRKGLSHWPRRHRMLWRRPRWCGSRAGGSAGRSWRREWPGSPGCGVFCGAADRLRARVADPKSRGTNASTSPTGRRVASAARIPPESGRTGRRTADTTCCGAVVKGISLQSYLPDINQLHLQLPDLAELPPSPPETRPWLVPLQVRSHASEGRRLPQAQGVRRQHGPALSVPDSSPTHG